jgi:urease accessory protein
MLQVFKSLPVVREAHRALPEAAASYARDTMTMGWEERIRGRGRRRSDRGLEFGTALERGTVLRAGDWLVIEAAATAVAVRERPEPVLVVTPRTSFESALFGYHIGNSHQPVMVTDTAIVCPDLPGVAEVLAYHRIPFARAVRPFTPVGLDGPAHRHQP